MTDNIRYISELPGTQEVHISKWDSIRSRIPHGFAIVVGVPTLVAMIYWGGIATPRYVSEAHFSVRKTGEARPNNLGLVLQNVGLTSGTSESFAVQDFMVSRDAARKLNQKYNLETVYSNGGADWFSRHPGFLTSKNDEGRYKAFRRYVGVTYNGTTGIVKLSVQAFTPEDAQNLSRELLAESEQLVNRLNERAAKDAVTDAETALAEASARRDSIQSELTLFRNQERFVDPQLSAAESTQLIAGLLSSAATIRAELMELRASAPQSPQLSVLENRLNAYEAQIAEARAKVAGDNESLAPKISIYEGLVLKRELADRSVMEASAGLMTAQQAARRQQLYLDRIVEPHLADKATQPQRLRAILIVFISSLMVYLLGRLIWAGLREHHQE